MKRLRNKKVAHGMGENISTRKSDKGLVSKIYSLNEVQAFVNNDEAVSSLIVTNVPYKCKMLKWETLMWGLCALFTVFL